MNLEKSILCRRVPNNLGFAIVMIAGLAIAWTTINIGEKLIRDISTTEIIISSGQLAK